jgi:hypothetical protein
VTIVTDTDRIDELLRTSTRIETKVDALDEKLDRHSGKLENHEVRLTVLEGGQQRQWERFALWVGVLGNSVLFIIQSVLGGGK